MREIKFRAWDKWDKIMIQPNNGDFIGWHAMSNWKDCLELMQFTGLHDKNGKEIFEGDIVDNIFIEGDPFTKGEVIFDNGAFTLRLTYGRHEYLPCLYEADDSEIEVIGNIWENPELLEGKEKGA